MYYISWLQFFSTIASLASGLMLPDKQTVLLNIWGIHHNPQYWGPNVEEFNPDRFLFGPPPAAGTYIPFSMGPRNCIGKYCISVLNSTVVVFMFVTLELSTR